MKRIAIIHGLLFVMVLTGHACGSETGYDYMKEGNRLYKEKKFDESIGKYESARKHFPKSPEIDFNMANAHYRKAEYDKAVKLYTNVMTNEKSSRALQRKALYNLGNCSYRKGETTLDTGLEDSLREFEDSIQYYREMIGTGGESGGDSPGAVDAKYNIEAARLRIQEIRDRQRQQQELEQKKKELRDKVKDTADKQEELEEKSRQLRDGKKEDPEKDLSEEADRLKEQQDENKRQTEELAEEMDDLKEQMAKSGDPQSDSQEKPGRAKEHLDESAKEQESASEQLDKEDFEGAQESQAKASESLRKALEQLEEEKMASDQEEEKSPEDEPKDREDKSRRDDDKDREEEQNKKARKTGKEERKKEGEISPEEAKEIIDMLRERFRERLKAQQKKLKDDNVKLLIGTEKIPVEKDW